VLNSVRTARSTTTAAGNYQSDSSDSLGQLRVSSTATQFARTQALPGRAIGRSGISHRASSTPLGQPTGPRGAPNRVVYRGGITHQREPILGSGEPEGISARC
jgi:hypothetical protein